jgi:hypothetical protein
VEPQAGRVDKSGGGTAADVVDPNWKYPSDIGKSLIAEAITFGTAHPYTLTIQWSGTPTIYVKQGKITTKGWPFKQFKQ